MAQNLDPFTALQVKRSRQRARTRIKHARECMWKLKGTRGMLQRSLDAASDPFLSRFLHDLVKEFGKSIQSKREEISDARLDLQ